MERHKERDAVVVVFVVKVRLVDNLVAVVVVGIVGVFRLIKSLIKSM